MGLAKGLAVKATGGTTRRAETSESWSVQVERTNPTDWSTVFVSPYFGALGRKSPGLKPGQARSLAWGLA